MRKKHSENSWKCKQLAFPERLGRSLRIDLRARNIFALLVVAFASGLLGSIEALGAEAVCPVGEPPAVVYFDGADIVTVGIHPYKKNCSFSVNTAVAIKDSSEQFIAEFKQKKDLAIKAANMLRENYLMFRNTGNKIKPPEDTVKLLSDNFIYLVSSSGPLSMKGDSFSIINSVVQQKKSLLSTCFSEFYSGDSPKIQTGDGHMSCYYLGQMNKYTGIVDEYLHATVQYKDYLNSVYLPR